MAYRGLGVNAQKQLTRDGVRFRNIGLNAPGAVIPVYSQPSATACAYTSAADQDAIIATAVAVKAKVLRVWATPYWPAQWTYGVNNGVAATVSTAADREAHYLKLDAFLAKCTTAGIGVTLSLFVRTSSASDICGQTTRAGWLSAGATRTYVTAMMQEIATRYLNHEAVYGYTLFGELNHYNDALDAALGNHPGVNTTYGSRASYTAADSVFNGTELRDLIIWASGIIRSIDPNRIILSGNGPNSYSRPGGAAGIATPMTLWYDEQVRDNPTNCGCIHWYGNVGYGSGGFKGLNSILTGVKHRLKADIGAAFFLEEFGNQPALVTSINANGTIATIVAGGAVQLDVGDPFKISGTTLNGSFTVETLSDDRRTITASTALSGSWSGSVKGLQWMTGAKLKAVLNDVINADVDVALFWMVSRDPLNPLYESIDEAGNEPLMAEILAANTRLGW